VLKLYVDGVYLSTDRDLSLSTYDTVFFYYKTQRNVMKTDYFRYGRFRLIHLLVAKLKMVWTVDVFR